jgi:hypothetical protein
MLNEIKNLIKEAVSEALQEHILTTKTSENKDLVRNINEYISKKDLEQNYVSKEILERDYLHRNILKTDYISIKELAGYLEKEKTENKIKSNVRETKTNKIRDLKLGKNYVQFSLYRGDSLIEEIGKLRTELTNLSSNIDIWNTDARARNKKIEIITENDEPKFNLWKANYFGDLFGYLNSSASQKTINKTRINLKRDNIEWWIKQKELDKVTFRIYVNAYSSY